MVLDVLRKIGGLSCAQLRAEIICEFQSSKSDGDIYRDILNRKHEYPLTGVIL